jgi:Tol biopolymer transport system component/imidazolonepropionase-like amidohydrolase
MNLRLLRLALVLFAATAGDTVTGAAVPQSAPKPVTVTVDEGTSMSVAVSPDGKMLAMDLQGSIWVMPATGGPAKRMTDLFSDAHQPVWSPDGKTIAFFAYRDGGYDLWAIAPDGSGLRRLTWGPFDDREPAFSHDGTRIAFSSDRGNVLGSDYNIFVLDLRSGEIRQLTSNPAEDMMPSWSPDDRHVAFASTRENGNGIWAVDATGGAERRLSTTTKRIDAVSWAPDGQILAHAVDGTKGWLEANGNSITGDEHVFPFRVSFVSGGGFFYTADGKIRKRGPNGAVDTIPFSAQLEVTPARNTYVRRKRDFNNPAPRKALGIVSPVLSPDGKTIAFAALGDIYLMAVGGKPRNITHDAAYDTDPAWSPDGSTLVYSSDKVGGLLQLWLYDVKSGRERQLTHISTQPICPAFSPDGKRIAYLNVDGMWRRAGVAVVDVASGAISQIHASIFAPGAPTWSADGARIAVAMVAPYSTRYREGTNQVLTMSSTGTVANSDDKWYAPVPNLSIDSRGGNGPVWSPDGSRMAAIYEGTLTVFPVSASGAPLGPPRHLTSEIAYAPSWSSDGRQILYQSNDKLRLLNVETGQARTVPLDLTYRVNPPKTHLVLHVGKLVDGMSKTARADMDIVIDGNRITAVGPHKAGDTAMDLPQLTAMPGLIDFHTHRQSDFVEQQGRSYLAYGVTTIRSPGGLPYEAVEDREATDAGIRVSPRIFNTGYLLEWQRVYYKMGIAISSPAQLDMELERSRILGFDLLKSYVRMPDLQQRHIVDFAHAMGVPASSHEIYPAAYDGIDSVEHTEGTSRRGYSPKMTLGSSYDDVARILGAAHMTMTPTLIPRIYDFLQAEPEMRNDPRLNLDPPWLKAQILGAPPHLDHTGTAKMVMDVQKAGGRIVAGTDVPEGMYLHSELVSYVAFGMSPYEALQSATVTPAEILDLDAGMIAPGKLADIVLVEGNPLENIADAQKVKRVIANGRMFTLEDLLSGKARDQH